MKLTRKFPPLLMLRLFFITEKNYDMAIHNQLSSTKYLLDSGGFGNPQFLFIIMHYTVAIVSPAHKADVTAAIKCQCLCRCSQWCVMAWSWSNQYKLPSFSKRTNSRLRWWAKLKTHRLYVKNIFDSTIVWYLNKIILVSIK